MQGLRFLAGISLQLALAVALGCNTGDKPAIDYAGQLKESDYNDRVKNIFAYIQENGFAIPTDQCGNIIILQTNLCNSCDKEKLAVILDSLALVKEPVYFVLADDNSEIKAQIQKDRAGTPIYIDSEGRLQKHNLSFMRNLRIRVCGRQITDWMFM